MYREQLIEESHALQTKTNLVLGKMTDYLECMNKIDAVTGDEFLTRSTVAELLHISPAQVNTLQHARKHPIVFTVTGKRNYKIHRDVFINWLSITGRKL